MAYVNLASLRLCTESEGPGRRFAIWVQGCEKRCHGCCNPEMQEIRRNMVVETSDLIRLIEEVTKNEIIEGISLIGGEPFLQAEGLGEVAEWAWEKGLTVLAFTGFLIEELKQLHNQSVDRLLGTIDILVDGPYVESLYDTERDWIGSRNQRAIFLTEAYKPGVEYSKQEHRMEVLVSEKDILINGWPYI